ncbi:developmentally-regulated GTP-binding protein 1 [Aphanomyces invadans]|uniref:Developmentally-regulated GTP-binding protein 1 n=1 Tax=Aphanomyces invadans TaxID=157072 RepID=A0A024TGM2_9STRA|nr:developmentally-regulated GTP-binding protein 1 [Aphanomyces invadans]ETV93203.1 developmentally-regulated GTP-binding protein 1 [Aphanomyces invadans]|eukprot:XP_008878225.1 developmentally-regulated GTP-binding protein 1 [Aphanomyces invadans]
MSSAMARINELQAEYDRTQKNKATMKHLCLIKAKIAKLRREVLDGGKSGGGGGAGEGFDVNKSGDTRVGLVGFPSVGKSTLLTKLTGTFSEAASYEFTTLTAIPGTVNYRGARIQILDLPGIIEGAKDGKGRGRQVMGTARTCNVILMVLDAMKPATHKKLIEHELEGFGIRLNKKPPNLVLRKKDKGGLNYTATCEQSELDQETVAQILKEYKIHNADVTLREDVTADELIDVIEGNRVYIPCLYVLNKIDQLTIEELTIIDQLPHNVLISAHHGWNLDELLEKIWDYANMIRIYTKPKGRQPDYDAPVILHDAAPTVEDFCMRLHKAILKQLKYANVWGLSVKHQPQKVGKEHVLMDEDIVQLVKKN